MSSVTRSKNDHSCCNGISGWVIRAKIKERESWNPPGSSSPSPLPDPDSAACQAVRDTDWGDTKWYLPPKLAKSWGWGKGWWYPSIDGPPYNYRKVTDYLDREQLRCIDGRAAFVLTRRSDTTYINTLRGYGTSRKGNPYEQVSWVNSWPTTFGWNDPRVYFHHWSSNGCYLGEILAYRNRDVDYEGVGSVSYLSMILPEKKIKALESGELVYRTSSLSGLNEEENEAYFRDAVSIIEGFDYVTSTEAREGWPSFTTGGGSVRDSTTYTPLDCSSGNDNNRRRNPDGSYPPDPDDWECFYTGLKNRNVTPSINAQGYAVGEDGRLGEWIYNPQSDVLYSQTYHFCGCDQCEIECGDCCISLGEVAVKINQSASRIFT